MSEVESVHGCCTPEECQDCIPFYLQGARDFFWGGGLGPREHLPKQPAPRDCGHFPWVEGSHTEDAVSRIVGDVAPDPPTIEHHFCRGPSQFPESSRDDIGGSMRKRSTGPHLAAVSLQNGKCVDALPLNDATRFRATQFRNHTGSWGSRLKHGEVFAGWLRRGKEHGTTAKRAG